MSPIIEHFPTIRLRGNIKLFEQAHPENVIYAEHNIIVDCVRSLFSRLMVSNTDAPETGYGVWGLAIGAGLSSWGNTPPPETALQTAILQPILRKRLSSAQWLDQNGNPTSTATEIVSYQTILNAVTDNIQVPIQEMGLIGGGTGAKNDAGVFVLATDMLTAPFWNPTTNPNMNSVTLINYKTMSPLTLPSGVPFVLDWQLQF